MLNIEILGSEVLRKTSTPVADVDDGLRAFIDEMFEAMARGRGVGLAAPQAGRTERFFISQVDHDKPRVFINPSITRTAEGLVVYEEGCLSIPGLYADVKRPAEITVQAYNEKGRPFTLDAQGFLARVIQHEIDHLEGILFIDKVSEAKRVRLLSQWQKRMRA
jgi:peptide deformylase